jgi:mannan endo-1,4-beta-mannosidase
MKIYSKTILSLALVSLGMAACKQETKEVAETERLYHLLVDVPRHGFMFGHQDATVYGIGWDGDSARSDVKSVCGDYPAVCGWEIGRIESGKAFSLDSVAFDRIRYEIIEQHKRGGINTISWHADNPVTGGDSWDVSAKDSVVVSILEGGKNHQKFLGWLDILASFFHSLQLEDGTKVPVLFRPWHEHTGSWFWWGNDHCTTEQYKQLWVMTWNYLREKGVDNLLYAYSPGGGIPETEYMERYPGDEYVNLLGFDYYQMNSVEGADNYKEVMNNTLIFLTRLGKEHNKPIAVTETGFETIPDATWWTNVLYPIVEKYPVSYVLVWRNARERPNHFYGPHPGHIAEKDFVKFYEEPKTLFAKEIEKLYKAK